MIFLILIPRCSVFTFCGKKRIDTKSHLFNRFCPYFQPSSFNFQHQLYRLRDGCDFLLKQLRIFFLHFGNIFRGYQEMTLVKGFFEVFWRWIISESYSGFK